jgi:hypothetical protein
MEGPAWNKISPGSGQSGMPSEDNLEEGSWTTRNTPWSAGVQDRRGTQGGGDGGGGGRQASHGGFRQTPVRAPLGRPDWRLPRINDPIHRPVVARLATKGNTVRAGPALTVQRPNRETASKAVGHPEVSLAVHDPETVVPTLVEGGGRRRKKQIGTIQSLKRWGITKRWGRQRSSRPITPQHQFKSCGGVSLKVQL